ncbi:MAG: exodeoxyribonuclease V subunit gamma [Planctomycetota bacterium]
MLEIRVAPHWDRLLDMLAAAIRGSRREDPLRLVRVLAPSPAAEAWLREALVVRLGVAARIEFALVERWLEAGLSPEDRADRLTTAELRLELLALLLDEAALDDPSLAAPRRTLEAVPAGAARRRRAFELASRLAPLFEEYALTRPDAIATWRRSAAAVGTGVAAWQHALFRAALARRGAASRPGQRFLCEIAASAPVADDATPLFVVAPGFLAPAYTAALARRTAATPGLLLQLRIDATAPAFRALEDWAQPEELFLDAFAAAGGTRVLAEEDARRPGRTWLDHLVRGEAAPAGEADDSLVVVDAPTPTREAEAVCDEIWRALLATRDEAAPLLPSDVLVLVAGADDGAYRIRLLAAAAARGLPAFETDAGAARRSGAVETAGDLLGLVGSRFERQAVFRLFRRPAFRARFPGADAEAWERWAVELEVRHGRDDADHAGSYLPRDLYHWDQALARLALARFLPEVEGGDPPLLAIGARRLAPAPFEADAAEVGRLSAVLRDLVARSRELGEGAPRPLRDWGRAFAALVEDFVAPAEGEDESVPLRIGAALRSLGEGAAAAELPLDFGSARAIALETVSGLAPRAGAARLRGIAIAALGAVRPPAARMIAVVGLDEDRFPAGSRRSALDLRRDDASPEEPSPRARDLQRFAEVLRGASDRLVLGHRGRDAATGDAREPSVVVRDIRAWSASADGVPRLPTRRIGSDPTSAPRSEAGPPRPAPDGFLAPRAEGAVFSSPTAEELRALHLRETYRDRTGRDPDGLEDLLAAEGDRDALRRFLALVELPAGRARSSPRPTRGSSTRRSPLPCAPVSAASMAGPAERKARWAAEEADRRSTSSAGARGRALPARDLRGSPHHRTTRRPRTAIHLRAQPDIRRYRRVAGT